MFSCPVCDCANAHSVLSVTAKRAAAHFLTERSDPSRYSKLVSCIETLWGCESCQILSCSGCGLSFAEPFIAGNLEFYGLVSVRNGYPSTKWEFTETVAILEERGIRGGKVLEIGAGAGHFLKRVSPGRFHPCNVTALEYNSRSVEALGTLGYNAVLGDFRDLLPADSEFRAIFMFQVLEHLDQVPRTFTRLRDLLAPGGDLFIAVPNPLLIEFNEKSGSLLDMPPNHIARWRQRTFQYVAQRYGFELVSIRVEPFSWRTFLAQDIGYFYLRKAQEDRTIAQYSRVLRSSLLGRGIMLAAAMAYAPARVPVWLRSLPELHLYGGSMLAHFTLPAVP